MMRKLHGFLASTALLLTSCGGGGGGGGGPPAPVNNPPTITSGTTATVPENATGTVYQAAATDPEGNAVTFSLSGIDAARFAITPAGAISFVAPPDFEAPADTGANNVYDILLTASDGASTSQAAIAITVTNQPDTAVVRQVGTGFVEPRQIVGIPGSNNLFVVERRGDIYLLDPVVGGRGTLFMSVGNIGTFDTFPTGNGLISVVPAPNYATSGVFYVSVTDPAGIVEVRRYTRSSPTTGNPASADVILRIPNNVRNNTAVEALLLFGPDGMLYVLTGENGNRLGPQDPADLRGKVLRIDIGSDAFLADPQRDYAIPADNPNVGGSVSEVAAKGLYDPWGASFNGADLLFSDYEPGGSGEINLMRPQDRGANYGWPFGQINPPPEVTRALIQPGLNLLTTGGPVYRGQLVPLRGSYLFAMLRAGIATVPASQLVQGTQPAFTNRSDLDPPGVAQASIFIRSFAEDSQGETYYLNVVGLTGSVYKIEAR